MIAGRLRWRKPGAKPPGKQGLAAFDFADGTLMFTEAASKKRASLHVVRGATALAEHDPGGIEPLDCALETFAQALTGENHTLKRSLTDPHLFSGIGNAYSDEILHRARLSPLRMSQKLTDEEISCLFHATRDTLTEWTERLRAQTGDGFPDKVTAFHDEMAVHGRYREPCPDCGSPVQRIAYAENECNYCATCQNEGACWPTVRYRACSRKTGPAPSTNSKGNAASLKRVDENPSRSGSGIGWCRRAPTSMKYPGSTSAKFVCVALAGNASLPLPGNGRPGRGCR